MPGSEEATACIECRKYKVKCEKVFPCKRCVELGLPCLPQIRKRGRPADIDLPLLNLRHGLSSYAHLMEGSFLVRIRNMIGMFFWKNEYLKATLGEQIDPFSMSGGLPTLKHPDVLAQCWVELSQLKRPSPEHVEKILAEHESWIPARILSCRDVPTRGATLFTYQAYGKHVFVPNKRFEEMFETAEESQRKDAEAAPHYSISSMCAGVNLESNRRKRPPEILHRICANSDHACYFEDLMRALVGKPSDEYVVTEGVYCMNARNDVPVICAVTRVAHLGHNGAIGGLFVSVDPLPTSTYLRAPPAQNVGFGSDKRVRKKPASRSGALGDSKPPAADGRGVKRARAPQSAPGAPHSNKATCGPAASGASIANVADRILFQILSEPEALEAVQSNPKLRAVFKECLSSPLGVLRHLNDPELSFFTSKVSAAASALPGGWMQFAAALPSAEPSRVLAELGIELSSDPNQAFSVTSDTSQSQEDARMGELLVGDELLDELVVDLRELVDWAEHNQDCP